MAKNFMSAMVNTKAATPQAAFSQTEKIKKEIVILESIKKFIPALSADEKQQLEQNIIDFGCKDALTIWETTKGVIEPTTENAEDPCYVLIDGHNRFEICQKFRIDFKITTVEFSTFEKVYEYMIDHQLGRRNLTPEQMAYFRGLKYNSMKKQEIQRDKTGKFIIENSPSGQNDQTGNFNNKNESNNIQKVSDSPSGQNDQTVKKASLSEQLAEQFKVGEKTIRRDADFAKGLDLLPIEVKNEVLQGKSLLNKIEITELGKLKDAMQIGEKVKQLLENQKQQIRVADKSKKDFPREKIINLAKQINTPEDCDKLILEIEKLKKKIIALLKVDY